MTKPLMIAVGGGSGSGKSTFVSLLQSRDPRRGVLWLCQDQYYKDLAHLGPSERRLVNFDQPGALDTALLFEHIEKLADGEAIEAPHYDFVTHTRSYTRMALEPGPVVIFDGIFSLYFAELRPFFHLKIFIETPDDLRFIRRLTRDMNERGRSSESILHQYLQSVRPMHLQYIQGTKAYADMIIPWEEKNYPAVDVVQAFISAKLALNPQ